MQLSIDHVSSGKSHSVLSCGNTGALMAISLLKLRTVASIKRPSIASIWPNIKGESIVLDLGANIKNDTNSLIDNAILGSALAKVLLSMTEPSVGLLNVGIEDMKGNENVQKASEILSEMSNKKQLNYYGFVSNQSFIKKAIAETYESTDFNGPRVQQSFSVGTTLPTATATIGSGSVTGFTITYGGAGYTSPPNITLTGNARAHAEITNGEVTKIVIDDAGSGYSEAPTVTFEEPVSYTHLTLPTTPYV